MKRSQSTKKTSKPLPRETRRSRIGTVDSKTAKKTRETETDGTSFWMRCPRCGLGLIETVKGPITTERCTACGAVWADPKDVERLSDDESSGVFRNLGK